MSFHTLILVGRLGQAPEMRYTPNGTAVANFNVATDRVYKNANGEQVKVTTWFRVSVWGKMAEACNQYLEKGSMVLVEGVLNPGENGQPKVWTAQDGRTGANYEVIANTVRFLSTSKKQDGKAEAVSEDSIPF